jgi:glyoxylase-like metal-dependent hydrolase (beta-lactamase superfamily II)
MRVMLPLLIGVLCVSHAVRGQEPSSFALHQVGPNVWAAIANPNAKVQAGGNAGFVIGDDGVAVVDTFMGTEAARQLLAEIRQRTKLPVKFVVNTHYHFDHVAGNAVFAEAGATVFAHSQRARMDSLGEPEAVRQRHQAGSEGVRRGNRFAHGRLRSRGGPAPRFPGNSSTEFPWAHWWRLGGVGP